MFSEISKISTNFSFLRVILITLFLFDLKDENVLIFLSMILLMG